MRYALIPFAGILFGLFFASTALASSPTQVCTMQYDPVCAAQQVECITAPCYPVYQTYGNACMANVANATIIHTGACTQSESGPVKTPSPYVPPKGCIAWFDGCNSCSAGANGRTMCTLRACEAESTTLGRCTAYASSTPPSVPHPEPGTTVATTTTQAPPVAVVAMEGHAPFLQRVWAWLTHLFRF